MTITKASSKLNSQPSIHSSNQTSSVSETMIRAVVLALGSNYQAMHYFPIARQQLAKLGQLTVSDELINADFTATISQPKPDYTNQCAHIQLYCPSTFDDLRQSFKHIEQVCHRQHESNNTGSYSDSNTCHSTNAIHQHVKSVKPAKIVTMDIDILAIYPCDANDWLTINKRLPLKSHEKIGVQQLNQRLDLGLLV